MYEVPAAGPVPPLPQDPRVTHTCSHPSDANVYYTVLEVTMYADLVDIVRPRRLQFFRPLNSMPPDSKFEH
jgi:hypothetical protein